MGRSMRWSTMFVVLLALAMGIGAGPAMAHSNKSIVRLAVTPDSGMIVVQAFLVYTNDHQPVRDEFVLAEVSGSGGTRGFQLRPDDRAPGYFASRVHLNPGRWTLRVSAKAATVGFATGGLTVDESGQPTEATFSSSFNPSTVSKQVGAPSSSPGPGILVVVGGIFLLALIALGAKVRASGRRAREPVAGGQSQELIS
jgi:hypothetical protein